MSMYEVAILQNGEWTTDYETNDRSIAETVANRHARSKGIDGIKIFHEDIALDGTLARKVIYRAVRNPEKNIANDIKKKEESEIIKKNLNARCKNRLAEKNKKRPPTYGVIASRAIVILTIGVAALWILANLQTM